MIEIVFLLCIYIYIINRYYGNEIQKFTNMCYIRTNIYISTTSLKGVTSGIKKNIYRTYINPNEINTSHINQLFINNKRMTRARYPNGDAEFMGYWTNPSGLLSKANWTPKVNESHSVEIIISQPNISNSEYIDFSIGLNGPLQEFEPPRIII